MAPVGKPTMSSTSRKRRQSTPAIISSRVNLSSASKASSSGSGVFKSPVSKLELARVEAAKLQQARVNASIERLASDKKTKKKTSNTPPSSTNASLKRKREESGSQQPRQFINEEQDNQKKKTKITSTTTKSTTEKRRATLNIRSLPSNQLSTTSVSSTSTSTIRRGIKRKSSRSPSPLASESRLQRPKVTDMTTTTTTTSSSATSTPSKRPESLFSRYSDASIQRENTEKKPMPRYLERLEELRRRAAVAEGDSETKDETEASSLPVRVDLNRVSNVSQLETVEGSMILETLMLDTTPRSERTQQSTSKSTRNTPSTTLRDWEPSLQEPQQQEQNKTDYDFSASILKPTPAPSWHLRPKVDLEYEEEQPPSGRRYVKEDFSSENEDEDEDDESSEEEDEEEDTETTESKILRVFHAKQHIPWKFVMFGSFFLGFLIVLAPFVSLFFQPPLPFCDSNPKDAYNTNRAIQMYYPPGQNCRTCPMYGMCERGQLVSCVHPYELKHDPHQSMCVEDSEVQKQIVALADTIKDKLIETAKKQYCQVSMWTYLTSHATHISSSSSFDQMIRISFSELKEAIQHSAYKGVASRSSEYVLKRAMDIALSDLQDVFIDQIEASSTSTSGSSSSSLDQDETEEQQYLWIKSTLAPYSCRMKHQFYKSLPMLLVLLLICFFIGFLYRKVMLYQAERVLVDRLLKEVRFFLLERAQLDSNGQQEEQTFYPSVHLRDHLFDTMNISHEDRKWLREIVWPKVVSLVNEDSRIRSRNALVRGHQMVVWEWISAELIKKKPKPLRAGQPAHASMLPSPPPPYTQPPYTQPPPSDTTPSRPHSSGYGYKPLINTTGSTVTPTYQSPTTLSSIRQRSRNTPTTSSSATKAHGTSSSASRPPATRPSIHSVTPNRYWR